MGVRVPGALRTRLHETRVAVHAPRAVRAVASVNVCLSGARARLVRVPRRRYLHVFRVDLKLAFGAEGASLYLHRLPGLYSKVPARKEDRALLCYRFLFVLCYTRVYVQLNVTAEADSILLKTCLYFHLNQVFKEHNTSFA